MPFLQHSDIEIRRAADGAPKVFRNDAPLPVFISLSHSQNIGFCAVTAPGAKLGCDLEKTAMRSDAFVEDYFTEKEQFVLAAAGAENRSILMNLVWSAKESTLKALRTGLSFHPRKIEIEYTPEKDGLFWNPLKVSVKDGSVFHGCWRVESELVYTVVSDREGFFLIENQVNKIQK